MINATDTEQSVYKVHKNGSLLDVLIEFDNLDDLNDYSYDNWFRW